MIEIATKKHPEILFIKMDIANVSKIFDENTFDGLLAVYTLYFVP